MIRFARLDLLWIFLTLVVAIAAFVWSERERSRRLTLLGISELPKNGRRQDFRLDRSQLLWCVTICMAACAALRPQGNPITEKRKQAGADIVLAVDVSDSMLAADVTPSRIERARREILDLLDRLKGERVALVIFSGTAFIQTPLTNDYASFRTFLDLIDPEFSPVPGSNIEVALKKSLEALGASPVGNLGASTGTPTGESASAARRGGAIILLTDGELFDGSADAMLELAKSHDIRLFGIAIGTEEGTAIRTDRGFKRDREGKLVSTKMNFAALEKVTTAGNGFAVRSIAGDSDTDRLISEGIQKLSRAESRDQEVVRYQEFFQVPLAAAVGLILFFVIRRGDETF